MMWVIGNISRRLAVLSVLCLIGFALYSQYAFQEPFMVTWTRYLRPHLDALKKNHPPLARVVEVIESGLAEPDPRARFAPTELGWPPARPINWKETIVGPRASAQAGAGDVGEHVDVRTAEELRAAVRKAIPGMVITILPGIYEFNGRSIELAGSGTPNRPIVLRAASLGPVTLRFDMLEGLHVAGANWIIENLLIDGVCAQDDSCEHAFHVVGGASGTVIRNNWVSNFNAAVKVNGENERYPDGGAVLDNAFVNDRPRNTENPVTVIDLVAASGWRVAGNFIADFAKSRGNGTSYGAFFKGGGKDNLFERNLVRCEWRHRGGIRIGFSFGGGGTTPSACRDKKCVVEQLSSVMRSNVVIGCPNDVGVYVNKSAGSVIHNNFILRTRGVDVRFPESSAEIFNNVIDGRIMARHGGQVTERANEMSFFDAVLDREISAGLFRDAAAGDLRATAPERLAGRGVSLSASSPDFCGKPYERDGVPIGPFQYGPNIGCQPVLP